MNNLTDLSIKEFLTLLASDAPTPGGGGAAAAAGGIAASLASMLANLTVGKKNFAEYDAELKELLAQAEALRSKLLELVEQDAKVFDSFMQCYRLPKATEEEKAMRKEAISNAAKGAAEIPLAIAETSLQIMEITARLVQIGNPNVITDGAVSALLARAAVRSSIYNVLVNIALTGDAEYNKKLRLRCSELEQQALTLEKEALTITDKTIQA